LRWSAESDTLRAFRDAGATEISVNSLPAFKLKAKHILAHDDDFAVSFGDADFHIHAFASIVVAEQSTIAGIVDVVACAV